MTAERIHMAVNALDPSGPQDVVLGIVRARNVEKCTAQRGQMDIVNQRERGIPPKLYPDAIPPTPPSSSADHLSGSSCAQTRFDLGALGGTEEGAKVRVRSSVRKQPVKVSSSDTKNRGSA